MQIYPEAETFTHLAKVQFGVKQYSPNTIVIYLSGSRTLFLKFFMGLFTHFVKNFTGISVFYRLRYMFF